jgi:hypothetical protein
MNQKQKDRWVKLRAKGAANYTFRGIVGFALCAVAGQIVWWLLTLLWKNDTTPHFLKEPGSAIASIVGFAIAGYLQATWEWRKNEREYLAMVESERDNPVAV